MISFSYTLKNIGKEELNFPVDLGIVVDSLLEIRDRLNSLSSDDLEKITESVEHYSEILRTGKKTRTVFLQVLKEAINY